MHTEFLMFSFLGEDKQIRSRINTTFCEETDWNRNNLLIAFFQASKFSFILDDYALTDIEMVDNFMKYSNEI